MEEKKKPFKGTKLKKKIRFERELTLEERVKILEKAILNK